MAADNRSADQRTCIVEDVPGLPDHMKFWVRGPAFTHPHPSFSSKPEAEAFLKSQGITDFDFEPFEP